MLREAVNDAERRLPAAAVLDRLRGWTAHEAIAAALFIFVRHADHPEAALLEAVNTPGDSDSIGTLVGALVGARCGVDALPERWRQNIERADDLERLAEAAVHVSGERLGVRPTVVFHHGQCPDGAAAAWILDQALRDHGEVPICVPIHPGTDGPELDLAEGADVWMVDVCLPGPALDRMHERARSLRVLDHHATSEKWAEGRPFVHVDTERCGALLAWRHFYGNAEPPPLVAHINDIDLHLYEIEYSRQLEMILRRSAHPSLMRALNARFNHDGDQVLADGEELLEGHDRRVERCVAQARRCVIGPWAIVAAELGAGDVFTGNDVANALAKAHDAIGVAWRSREDGSFTYSLRSVPGEGPGVAELAEGFGGGGHLHAAGMRTDHQVLDFSRERPDPREGDEPYRQNWV